jgi:hypothetical protein
MFASVNVDVQQFLRQAGSHPPHERMADNIIEQFEYGGDNALPCLHL